MDQTEPKLVTAAFNSKEDAERAYAELTKAGYDKEDIHLVMSEDTRNKHFHHSSIKDNVETEKGGTQAAEGAGIGSAFGGTIGALVGVIAAIGTTVALPGLGLVVAGPIVGGLVGAGSGAAAGGLVGALAGAGIPEDEAKAYEEHVRNGGIVMGVEPRNAKDRETIKGSWADYCNAKSVHC